MAIFHMSAKIISRGKGQSAVAGAAYRHAAKMDFEREGRSVNYENKDEVVSGEVTLPKDAPDWIRAKVEGLPVNMASANVWNAVENFERRADSQLAREIVVALPKELTQGQNEDLLRQFSSHFTGRGHVVDWAFHNAEGNPHAHIMLTLRPLTVDGFGKKKTPLLDEDGQVMRSGEGKNARVIYREFFGDKATLRAERTLWADLANVALKEAGVDAQIDPRSFKERGIEMEPTTHRGLASSQMTARGIETDRAAMIRERELANAALIEKRPEVIFDVITGRKAVFDGGDIAKALLTYVQDQETFTSLLPRVMASAELVGLQREVTNPLTRKVISKQKLTTRTMVTLETEMIARAVRMRGADTGAVSDALIESAFTRFEDAKGFALADEQKAAVRFVAGAEQISPIVGLAGTGKSTALMAARLAWEGQGKRVLGFAIASQAAKGLQDGSGIESRTLASLNYRLGNGKEQLTANDVLVVDEAGMAGSRELARLLERAEAVGAKVVPVGDPSQLPAISAGAAFRAIIEHTGFAELESIRRQKTPWMREASVDFARGRVEQAVKAYEKHGFVTQTESAKAAIDALAKGFVADFVKTPDTLALAHSNKAVEALNTRIRELLKERGVIGQTGMFKTSRGALEFGEGDRIVFLQNDSQLLEHSGLERGEGVRNGQRAIVEGVEDGKLTVRLEDGQSLTLDSARYNNVTHGFATTIHKAQGMTVTHSHFLAQRSTVANLANVAMTRHRDTARIYYSRHSFNDLAEYKHGLASALARVENKESVTDYDLTAEGRNAHTIDGFGARRGMDTYSDAVPLKQSDLEAAIASQWFIAPRALNSYPAMPEQEANIRMMDAKAFTRGYKISADVAERVFVDPKAAMAKLSELVKTSPLEGRALGEYVFANIDSFGPMRGRTGFTASKADKTARAEAVKSSRTFSMRGREWKIAFEGERTEQLASVIKERALDAQGIKALRPEDLGLVALFGEDKDTRDSALSSQDFKGASAQRIAQFNDDIERRFGHVAAYLDKKTEQTDPVHKDVKLMLERNKALLLNVRQAAYKLTNGNTLAPTRDLNL